MASVLRTLGLDPKKCDGPCRRRYLKPRDPSDPKYLCPEILARQNIYYGDLKRCSKCKSVRYCSPECQREHWASHKAVCRPVAVPNESGSSIRDEVKKELEELNDESPNYDDIAKRESAIYKRLTGTTQPYEAMAFPHLFMFGTGCFGCPLREKAGTYIRFKDHHHHCLCFYDGRFRNCPAWCTWAKSMERQIYDSLITDLANERLAQKTSS